MKLYLVRHAESVANVTRIHQTNDTALSEKGILQTQDVAGRFKNIPVDVILSSPSVRAKHTADEIAKILDKEVIVSDLLPEFKRPSEIEGKYIDDPEIVHIKKLIEENSHDPGWHYSDEENFFDILERVKKIVALVEEQGDKNIVVVTHSGIIQFLTRYLLLEDLLSPEIEKKTRRSLRVSNTGITIFEKNENGVWQLFTFNDQTHLGDI